MIHINLNFYNYRKYIQTSSCIISGQGFYEGKHYKDTDFADLVSTWSNRKEFLAGIAKLSGFFVIVKKKNNSLFAVVDRVRSIPLFYGQKENNFYLSDDAEWVRKQVEDNELDSIAKEEFLLTGYVTGKDTLFPNVKQLQAGEALFVEETYVGLEVKTERYYKFIHKYEENNNIQKLMDEHDKVLLNIFRRLIKVANGRKLLVPLSGGLDSRLIVLMLKRLGYENVLTFSYGRIGNKESEVSRKVAERLGLQWYFIPYSNEKWFSWYNSLELKKYFEFAGGLSSIPHIQDWPAVWQLKEKKLIPKNSIFVPGHTGDFISGGHIPIIFKKLNEVNNELLLTSIVKKHYVLQRQIKSSDLLQNEIKEKILILSEASSTQNNVKASSKYEKWEWQERQAKFIVNSIRVYDYWGYEWWIPLWDYDYMKFWIKVPLMYRINQYMFKEYLQKLTSEIVGDVIISDEFNLSYQKKLKKFLSSYINDSSKAKIKKILKSNKRNLIREYKLHSLAWWGIYTFEEYLLNAKMYENINSALAIDYIKYVSVK